MHEPITKFTSSAAANVMQMRFLSLSLLLSVFLAVVVASIQPRLHHF